MISISYFYFRVVILLLVLDTITLIIIISQGWNAWSAMWYDAWYGCTKSYFYIVCEITYIFVDLIFCQVLPSRQDTVTTRNVTEFNVLCLVGGNHFFSLSEIFVQFAQFPQASRNLLNWKYDCIDPYILVGIPSSVSSCIQQ